MRESEGSRVVFYHRAHTFSVNMSKEKEVGK